MSYFELKSLIEDLGYTNMTKCTLGPVPCKSLEVGLRCIVSDHDIAAMLNASRMTRVVEVYSEHDEPINNILSSLPLENSEHDEPNKNNVHLGYTDYFVNDLAMNDELNNVPLGEHNESSESDGYYAESEDEKDSSESSSVYLNLSDIDDEFVKVKKKKLEMRKKSTKRQTQTQPSNLEPTNP